MVAVLAVEGDADREPRPGRGQVAFVDRGVVAGQRDGHAAVVSPFGRLVRKVKRLIVPRPISQKSCRDVRSWVTSTVSS